MISLYVSAMDDTHTMERISQLESLRGNGTTLVSLLIPERAQLSLSRQHIVKEMSEATNIKSRQTRHGVQKALRSVKSSLDLLKDNTCGYAVYAGLTTSRGGSEYFV